MYNNGDVKNRNVPIFKNLINNKLTDKIKRRKKSYQVSLTDIDSRRIVEIFINTFLSSFKGEILGKEKRKFSRRKLIALRPACVTNRPNGEIIHEQRPYAREDHSGSVSIGVGFHPYCPSHHPLIRLFVLA